MRIAINTRFLLSTKMEGFGWYTFEIAKRLVLNHPEHEFVFFFDRAYDEKFIFAKNVTPIVLSPPARHPLLFIYWFEFALKKALKKQKIDVLFSPDGYLSLRSNVPQIGVIHDINFEHFPKDIPFTPRIYLRHYFPRFAQKATKIITVSEASKIDISKTYKIEASKIRVAWNGASEHFKPVDDETKQSIRNFYSNGKPYFLFVGAIHPRKNVKRLIEAFIQFKKGSQLDIQLVIVGASLWKNKSLNISISEEISSQIHFTGHLPIQELAKVMGSAFSLTYVPYFEGFGIPLVEAMKCGVPILSGNKTSLPEVAGDAALYCDPFDIQDIVEKMQEISASESLRENLKQKGLERSKLFSWDKAAEIVWEEISTISSNN
jgi:glycosyltransferase involved in cell wall biosynthesis